MSLGRLLTSGKSLIGLTDLDNRYRMRQGVRLPKFGSSGNPFLARTEPAEPVSPAPGGSANSGITPAEQAAAKLKRTQRLPVISPAGDRANDPVPGSLSKLAKWAGGLVDRLKPRRRRPQAQAVPRPAAPGSSIRPAVQGELSLDRVKVVRNDLTEADVEVVPARATPRAKPAPAQNAKETGELVSTETP